MQANSLGHHAFETDSTVLGIAAEYVESHAHNADSTDEASVAEATHFYGVYSSGMAMFADAATVTAYLNNHAEWFQRCAHPMTAEPLGNNGYALTIGKFGALGYSVEPKLGLHLLPPDAEGVYRIETIPVPDYFIPGYSVDFRASLQLLESELDDKTRAQLAAPESLPRFTNVDWTLNLDVAIQFPRMIHSLPNALVKSTGDRLLNQIVRQMSRSLTYKVQVDFHTTHDIPFSKPRKR